VTAEPARPGGSNTMRLLCALTVLSLAAAAKKAKLQPSEDCKVTSTYADGTEVTRDCYVLSEDSAELRPGTKGRFESCTQ
jgi:hypothetical protein